MISVPWVEKYRPTTLNDVVSHEVVIQTIKKFVAAKNIPHILLHGPPGTGKTSTVKALARDLFGGNYERMVLELNASDDRGIKVVQERVKTFAGAKACSAFNAVKAATDFRLKLVILDEADQLSHDAQMALRRIIEDHAATVRFFIICNYVNKLAPAIQSRCTKFRFPPVPTKDILARLREVATAESLELSEDALLAFVQVSKGDLRRALNYLQACAMQSTGEIDRSSVLAVAGLPSPEHMTLVWNAMCLGSFEEAFIEARQLVQRYGYAVSDIITCLHERLVKLDLNHQLAGVFVRLADIEFRLSQGADELIQLGDVVCAMHETRDTLGEIIKQVELSC